MREPDKAIRIALDECHAEKCAMRKSLSAGFGTEFSVEQQKVDIWDESKHSVQSHLGSSDVQSSDCWSTTVSVWQISVTAHGIEQSTGPRSSSMPGNRALRAAVILTRVSNIELQSPSTVI